MEILRTNSLNLVSARSQFCIHRRCIEPIDCAVIALSNVGSRRQPRRDLQKRNKITTICLRFSIPRPSWYGLHPWHRRAAIFIMGGGIAGGPDRWEIIVRKRLALLAVTCAAIQCFVVSGAVGGGPETADAGPVFPGKEWAVSTPEEQGMDLARLARLVESLGTYRYDSLTIVCYGRIVSDAYYAPYLPDISHDLRSVTKSVIGTLTAIEIARGLLDSSDHKVLDLFPDKKVANVDDNKKTITVQNLLDMTSGIAWNEKNYTPDETVMRMYEAPDPTAFVLDQPMASAPGTQFVYDSGNPYLLSAIISRKTGQNAFEFAKKELFGPLGISSARWPRTDKQGVIDGEAGTLLSPHDMARIGYLYLRNGNWNRQQIIPSWWVERTKAGQVPATFGLHYANLWWSLPEKSAYVALGRHSQHILVIPRVDIVAVLTGSLRDDVSGYSLGRLIDELSEAVRSDRALPANPVATSLLAGDPSGGNHPAVRSRHDPAAGQGDFGQGF